MVKNGKTSSILSNLFINKHSPSVSVPPFVAFPKKGTLTDHLSENI